MALRIYKFEFRGMALGGQAVVVANSFLEAKEMVKPVQPLGEDPTCSDEKGEVIKAGVVFYEYGDY